MPNYHITCPYCFWKFTDDQVLFRSETYFDEGTLLQRYGNESELELNDEKEKLSDLRAAKRFLLKEDKSYQSFWQKYGGTSEPPEKNLPFPQWQLPVIGRGDGISKLVEDADHFVIAGVDAYQKTTNRRICPECHNPLPLGYGKHKTKMISIIGVTSAGKTVYISQLLRGMEDYAAKAGLVAFFASPNERLFVKDHPVIRNVRLPESTPAKSFSQPMFYDIVQRNGTGVTQDTIVLYDIAGENCYKPEDMVNYSKFVQHSDGLILLIDPKQLHFIPGEMDTDESKPSTVLNTLHGVLTTKAGEKSKIPVAVCVSKSDLCSDILPPLASEDVSQAGVDEFGLATKQFNGREYNILSQELTQLININDPTFALTMSTNYQNYNYFSVAAIGCSCGPNEKGVQVPLDEPNPRRIEEPILWLFKHFGYIGTNEKVRRPVRIKQPDREVYEKVGLFRKEWVKHDGGYSEFEEDPVLETIERQQ